MFYRLHYTPHTSVTAAAAKRSKPSTWQHRKPPPKPAQSGQSRSTEHNQSVRFQSRPAKPDSSSEPQWLAKVLATAGVASRRTCIDLIKQGAAKVNGVVVIDPATKVDSSTDVLEVNGKTISQPGSASRVYYYFAMNKPAGYICSNVSDKAPGKRAVDLLQPWLSQWEQKHKGQLPPRLFTVGRLDVATSGLLFLTNDGDWANKVIHPSANIIKEYWAALAQQPTPGQLRLLRAGTTIEGVHVRPKLVNMRPAAAAGSKGSTNKRAAVQIHVSEGKKHEVRLLVAAAGLQLLALERVRVGGFVLPKNLKVGGYMQLDAQALQRVLSGTGPAI